MNKIEAARLAAMANALRPDWHPQSTLTLLGQVAGWAYRDAAVQLAWLAADEETTTPARLLQDGPWRKLTRLVDGNAPQPQPYQPMFPSLTDDEREAAAIAAKAARAVLGQAVGTVWCQACNQSIPRPEWAGHTCEVTA